MNHVVELGSGAMIYVQNFIKIGSGIQPLLGEGGDTPSHRQQCDLISLICIFLNKERRLKNKLWLLLYKKFLAVIMIFKLYASVLCEV
jgi:hypothetical protein